MKHEPIAIVGIGCRAPGGITDIKTFWEVLINGVDTISEVPPERWDIDTFYDADPMTPGKMVTRWGGFTEHVDQFDAAFFGISPREAQRMDPQQRLMLEVTWEALQDAGFTEEYLSGSRTGVFTGISTHDYSALEASNDPVNWDAYQSTGLSYSITAGRISFLLNLHGPSIALDTACSSSLVAIDLACLHLRQGLCDIALGGGVNLILSPQLTVSVSNFGMMAPDGRCKTFDARADGYVRGEGCGVVVLKRLADALADGDAIYALIRGSAVNQDGYSEGITMPSCPAQQAVLRQALDDAGLTPGLISYIEAHGTGTPVGDPVEFEALKAVYGASSVTAPVCPVGAVKTAIGHLEAASGVLGLIKTVLCMKHGIISPNLHFDTLNPRISISGTRLIIPTAEQPWPDSKNKWIAGVSSFGFSGTNCHVIIEETPETAHPGILDEKIGDDVSHLLPLSAKDPDAIRAIASRFSDFLSNDPPASLYDVCYTAGARRAHYDRRLAVVGNKPEEVARDIRAYLNNETFHRTFAGQRLSDFSPSLVFVFSGQGSQWHGMGRQLMKQEAIFRATMEECDRAFNSITSWSLIAELETESASSRLSDTEVVQPLLCALQISLVELWRSFGIKPDVVIGHSIGEVAAAYAAGILDVKEALRLACNRGRIMQRATGLGKMAAVGLAEEALTEVLRALDSPLSIAAVNSPRSCVVAGEERPLQILGNRLEQQRVFFRMLDVNYAFHSPQMNPFLNELEVSIGELDRSVSRIPFFSSVTGTIENESSMDARYWTRGVRSTVRFAETIGTIIRKGYRDFLEIGPHPVLLSAVNQSLRASQASGTTTATLRRHRADRGAVLESLATLYCLGYPVNWNGVYKNRGTVARLPTYPWQRQSYWMDGVYGSGPTKTSSTHPIRYDGVHPLLGRPFTPSTDADTFYWESAIDLDRLPYLKDHCIENVPVMPAAAFVEWIFAAVRETFGVEQCALENVRFLKPLFLPSGEKTIVQVVLRSDTSSHSTFQILAKAAHKEAMEWVEFATGDIQLEPPINFEPTVPVDEIQLRCPDLFSGGQIYQQFSEQDLDYGPRFQRIDRIWRSNEEAIGQLKPFTQGKNYILHPTTLDAGMQVFAGPISLQADVVQKGGCYVPVGIERMTIVARPGETVWSHVRLDGVNAENPDLFTGDFSLINDDGKVFLKAHGLRLQRFKQTKAQSEDLADWLYEIRWEKQQRTLLDESVGDDQPAKTKSTTWILFGDEDPITEAVCTYLNARNQECVRVHPGEYFEQTADQTYKLDPASSDAYRDLLKTASINAQGSFRGIIYLWATSVSIDDNSSFSPGTDSYLRDVFGVLYLVQALAGCGWRDDPRLWIITRSVHAVSDTDTTVSLRQAPLWGLARVVAHEHTSLHCSLIDLGTENSRDEWASLCEECWHDPSETQTALRGPDRYVARLVRRPRDSSQSASPAYTSVPIDHPFVLLSDTPGILDGLHYHKYERHPPAQGEVEVRIRATGLNFRDVMKAMDLYPGEDEGPVWVGLECAGTVSAVGEGVRAFSVGDEVIALSPACFASYVTTSADLVFSKPPDVSDDEAATIPVAFLTAYYALVHLGRLTSDDRVLIHSASGGVGLAAVQIAQNIGAEIFATAGSEEKRVYLRGLGIQHVMDSRSSDFAREIWSSTEEEGVDVVLNSLAGDAFEKSLSLMRPYGRFLEIGKRDIYANRKIGLAPFQKNLAMFSIDMAELTQLRPDLVNRLMNELLDRFVEGEYRPLPLTLFPITETVEAFRFMTRSKHIGKVIVSAEGVDEIDVLPSLEGILFDRNSTYMITGGLGGLGLTLTQWMVEKGAGHLVLLSNHRPTESEYNHVAEIAGKEAQISVLQADVADVDEMKNVFVALRQSYPDLRGVWHLAGILDDNAIIRMDREKMERVLRPKILGAWNLHALTTDLNLDHFILFSSVSSLFGLPGQSNYAAANTFLDTLAWYRQSIRLPATSINWGAWLDAGMAARMTKRERRVALRGLTGIKPKSGLQVLELLLRECNRAQICVMPLGKGEWRRSNMTLVSSPLLERLFEETEGNQDSQAVQERFMEEILALNPGPPRRTFLEKLLCEEIAHVLRLDLSKIDRHTLLGSLGFDSLMALELRNRLELRTGIVLPATLLWSGNTNLGQMAEFLAQKMNIPLETEDTTSAISISESVDKAALREQIEQLSDEEAENLLIEKLERL